MSGREQQINDALRALDDMHRECRIERDDYRERRRCLLDSLSGTAQSIGHDTVRRAVPVTEPKVAHATSNCGGPRRSEEETPETRREYTSAPYRTAYTFALGALAVLACAAALSRFLMNS